MGYVCFRHTPFSFILYIFDYSSLHINCFVLKQCGVDLKMIIAIHRFLRDLYKMQWGLVLFMNHHGIKETLWSKRGQ